MKRQAEKSKRRDETQEQKVDRQHAGQLPVMMTHSLPGPGPGPAQPSPGKQKRGIPGLFGS